MLEPPCNCRLRSPLSNNEALPEKLCRKCAPASVLGWIRSLPDPGPDTQHLCVPLDLGRYAIWDREQSSPVLVYPKSIIAVVVRQWVEEGIENSDKMFKQHQVALKACVDKARWLLSDNVQENLVAANLLDDLQGLLIGTGLPSTPGMAQWLLSETQPDHPFCLKKALPTRGVLVTSIGLNQSFLLRDTDIAVKQQGHVMPEMLHFLNWAYPWSSEALVKRAEKCGRTHAAWWLHHGKTLPKVTLSGRPVGVEDADFEADIASYFAGDMDKEQVIARQTGRLLPSDAQQKAAVRKSIQDTLGKREKKLSR